MASETPEQEYQLSIMGFHGTRLNRTIIGLFCLFSLVGLLNNYGAGFLRLVGFGSILTVLFMAQVLLVYRRRFLPKQILGLVVMSISFITLYIANLSQDYDSRAMIIVLQACLMLGYLLSFSLAVWNDRSLAYASILFCILNIILNTYLVYLRFFLNGIAESTSSMNGIGAVNFYLLFPLLSGWKLMDRKPGRWIFLFSILLNIFSIVFITNSRSILVAGFAGFCMYFLWPMLTKIRYLFRAIICVIFVTVIGLTYLYNQLSIIQSGLVLGGINQVTNHLQARINTLTGLDLSQLDELALEQTNKSLFSGREKIWPYLVQAIEKKPTFGYGSGALPDDFLPPTSAYLGLSSHSYYIQISLQVGLIGLTLLLAILYSIWKLFWLGRRDALVRLAGAFCIAILIHQAFEVSLTQNILIIGIFQWFILAVGVSRSIYGLGDHSLAAKAAPLKLE